MFGTPTVTQDSGGHLGMGILTDKGGPGPEAQGGNPRSSSGDMPEPTSTQEGLIHAAPCVGTQGTGFDLIVGHLTQTHSDKDPPHCVDEHMADTSTQNPSEVLPPPRGLGDQEHLSLLAQHTVPPPQGPASHILLRPTCPQREPEQGPTAGSLTHELSIQLSDVTAPRRYTQLLAQDRFAHGKTGQAASAGPGTLWPAEQVPAAHTSGPLRLSGQPASHFPKEAGSPTAPS